MADLEDRLRALGSARRAASNRPVPDVDALLRRGQRRRQAKLLAASFTALTAVVLLSAGLFADDGVEESRVVSTPDRTVASTTSTTTGDAGGELGVGMSPTTTAASSYTSEPKPKTPPSTSTSVPSTTTTLQRPAAQVDEPGLWLVGLDGSGLHRVGESANPSFSAWSPDGRYLATPSSAGSVQAIDIVSSSDGTVVSTIPLTDSGWVECLDWSSVGRLAWKQNDGTQNDSALYMATITSSGQVDPTGAPRRIATMERGGHVGFWDFTCRWSPDGSTLAVASGPKLFQYAADGSVVREYAELAGTALGGIAWAPDGSAIAAITRASGKPGDVVILRGALHSVARHVGYAAWRLAWSNDPAVLYMRNGSEIASVWPADGPARVVTRLDDVAALTMLPDWRFLHITSGLQTASELRFISGSWQRGAPLLIARTGDGCDGTFFGSFRLSPDARSVAVQVLSRAGVSSRECAATFPS